MALRGSERVAPNTRARIMETALELGYRPNPTVAALMRSMRSKKTSRHLTTMGLIIPVNEPQWNGRHRYIVDIVSGVRERCNALGFGYEQFVMQPDQEGWKTINHVIDSRGIDGLILGPQYDTVDAPRMNLSQLAYVAIGLTFKEIPAHRVTTTTLANIRHALEHTLALGWNRPGIIITDRDNDSVENIMLGAYLGYLHRRIERAPAPLIYKEKDFNAENVITWMRREGVNAILCSREIISTWLRDAGVRIGTDVAFALLDRPRGPSEAAGIMQRLHEVGGTSVELLGELIHTNERGLPEIPRVIEVEGEWMDGPSMPPCPHYPRR
jgi:DNA-binding LacI/PurR family transcriptional regulator